MTTTDRDAVANPLAYGILWKLHRPFLLTGLTKGLPQPFPWRDTGTLPNDADLPNDSPTATDRHKMLLAFLNLRKAVVHQGYQFWRDGYKSLFVTFMAFSLGASHCKPCPLKVHILPSQKLPFANGIRILICPVLDARRESKNHH